MEIKKESTDRIKIDISEWNETVSAYIKPLNGFERLTLNDFFLTFYNKENEANVRFDAGFRAALLVLVDDNGDPLLHEDDRTAIKNASFIPLFRLFDLILKAYENNTAPLDTLKKN